MSNITLLLTAIVEGGIVPIEQSLQQLLTQRALGTAQGEQLDILGAVVGLKRQGFDDTTFTQYIRAQIATNRSTGNTNDLIEIVSLILNNTSATITAANQNYATVAIQVGGISVSESLADVVISFLLEAVSGGVRPILISSDETPDTTFKWDTAGRGFDVAPMITARDHVLGF